MCSQVSWLWVWAHPCRSPVDADGADAIPLHRRVHNKERFHARRLPQVQTPEDEEEQALGAAAAIHQDRARLIVW